MSYISRGFLYSIMGILNDIDITLQHDAELIDSANCFINRFKLVDARLGWGKSFNSISDSLKLKILKFSESLVPITEHLILDDNNCHILWYDELHYPNNMDLSTQKEMHKALLNLIYTADLKFLPSFKEIENFDSQNIHMVEKYIENVITEVLRPVKATSTYIQSEFFGKNLYVSIRHDNPWYTVTLIFNKVDRLIKCK